MTTIFNLSVCFCLHVLSRTLSTLCEHLQCIILMEEVICLYHTTGIQGQNVKVRDPYRQVLKLCSVTGILKGYLSVSAFVLHFRIAVWCRSTNLKLVRYDAVGTEMSGSALDT